LLGCTSVSHTVEPYRSDPRAGAELERHAREVCERMEPPDGLPERPFVTDGCSCWPDRDWVGCCVEHDAAYWCGGTRRQRREADEGFRRCVRDGHASLLARLMHWGVRLGGHPVAPTHFRWGYGRDYPAGYEPEPESEPDGAGGAAPARAW
jgi:hypothetical protein